MSYSIIKGNESLFNKEIEYLTSHNFKPHSYGNSNLYGLNYLGCCSIIQFNNKLWMFYAFKPGTDYTIYVNKDCEMLTFNPYNKNLDITRMEEDN